MVTWSFNTKQGFECLLFCISMTTGLFLMIQWAKKLLYELDKYLFNGKTLEITDHTNENTYLK